MVRRSMSGDRVTGPAAAGVGLAGNGSATGLPGPGRGGDAAVSVVRRPLPRRRRRPVMIVLGVVLAALGGLVAARAAAGAGDRAEVLAVARGVAYGQVIGEADLAVARVAPDAALAPLPAADRGAVVGRHAAADLFPGMLLTAELLTDDVAPGAATELVGVALPADRLPNRPLRPGDRVLIVGTPAVDGDLPGEDGGPAGTVPAAAATVVAVGPATEDGARVVDVTVPAGQGPALAARAATSRVAVVLQPPPGAGG
jgi:hypothetical protein